MKNAIEERLIVSAQCYYEIGLERCVRDDLIRGVERALRKMVQQGRELPSLAEWKQAMFYEAIYTHAYLYGKGVIGGGCVKSRNEALKKICQLWYEKVDDIFEDLTILQRPLKVRFEMLLPLEVATV